MFFNNKKKFANGQVPKKHNLKFNVRIELKTSGEYSMDTYTIAQMEIGEVLDSNTDTKIKEIKAEVERKLADIYEATMHKIEVSENLSDGYL